jgi:transcriptional regulator with XRE-family HTH domain
MATKTPTAMGQRILDFMRANNVTNKAQFAEGVLGISKQRFQQWLYVEIRDVSAAPLLRCADVLGTNPEYLLGATDDPRPLRQIGLREAQLLDAFRVMDEKDQDRLLKQATDWVTESGQPASALAPFRLK